MKPNRFKQVRAEGRVPVGQMLWESGSRGMARMMDACDLDFAIIDTEHAAFSSARGRGPDRLVQRDDDCPFRARHRDRLPSCSPARWTRARSA